jgi:hypothetical protein
MSAFKKVENNPEFCCWEREVDFLTTVSVFGRCFYDYHESVVEWETLVTFQDDWDWYAFEGDFREQLAGLTAAQLREWCEAKVDEDDGLGRSK